MVTIKKPFLKKQLDKFSSLGSTAEQHEFLENFNQQFASMSEADKEKVRAEWKGNMAQTKKRLDEIDSQLDANAATIQIFPANPEEKKLVEAVLTKMNVRFKVA